MPRYAIVEAPSALRHIPEHLGVERAPEVLLGAGLADGPAGRQAVGQPGSEQNLRRALDAQMLGDMPEGRRRLHDRVPGHTGPFPVSVTVNLAQLGWIDQTRHSSID